MPDLSEEIADLETEIERLSEVAERCRKIASAARIGAAGGGLILISMIIGVLPFRPEVFVVAIAAVLGGIALRGTNRSTLDEVRGKILNAEERRAALIDALRLRAADSFISK